MQVVTAFRVNTFFGHYYLGTRAEVDQLVVHCYYWNEHVERHGKPPEIEQIKVKPIGLAKGFGGPELWAMHGNRLVHISTVLDYYNDERERCVVADYSGGDFPKIPEGGQQLIRTLEGSDSGETEIPWEELAQVNSCEERTHLERPLAGHGPYANPGISKVIATMQDGTTKIWWATSVGYFEGYQYDLYRTLKAAQGDFTSTELQRQKANWTALECWECGAKYDKPGHVEPGQMGCDRCNN